MEFGKFADDYRRWRWVPRSTNEAFRDASYASSIEVFAPRKSGWLEAIFHAVVWLAAVVGFGVVLYGIARGLT